jgi:hypothetical protein
MCRTMMHWRGRLGSRIKVALALGLNDFLGFLPVVGRRSEFFLKRGHLLTSQFGGGLVLYLYAFFGQGFDHPVHSNVQVFGRLL